MYGENIKIHDTPPFRFGLGSKKPILAIFCTWTPRLGTKLCPYELIFYAPVEENSTEHLCFIKKKLFYQVDLEKSES